MPEKPAPKPPVINRTNDGPDFTCPECGNAIQVIQVSKDWEKFYVSNARFEEGNLVAEYTDSKSIWTEAITEPFLDCVKCDYTHPVKILDY